MGRNFKDERNPRAQAASLDAESRRAKEREAIRNLHKRGFVLEDEDEEDDFELFDYSDDEESETEKPPQTT